MELLPTDKSWSDSCVDDVSSNKTDHDGVSTGMETSKCNMHIDTALIDGDVRSSVVVESPEVKMFESAGVFEKDGSRDKKSLHSDCSPSHEDLFSLSPTANADATIVELIRKKGSCSRGNILGAADLSLSAVENLRTSPKHSTANEATVVSCLRYSASPQEGHHSQGNSQSSFAKTEQEDTSASCVFSDHRQPNRRQPRMPHDTANTEVGKLEAATFNKLELNRGTEHAYDMNFNLDDHVAPLEETFLEENCMLPPLDAVKSESMQTGVGSAIVENSSDKLKLKTHANVQTDSSTSGLEKDFVAIHNTPENIMGEPRWNHDAHNQQGCEISAEPSHISQCSVLSDRHVQAHEESGARSCIDLEKDSLSPDVMQENQLTFDSREAAKHEIHVQCDKDGVLPNAPGVDLGTFSEAGNQESKKLEMPLAGQGETTNKKAALDDTSNKNELSIGNTGAHIEDDNLLSGQVQEQSNGSTVLEAKPLDQCGAGILSRRECDVKDMWLKVCDDTEGGKNAEQEVTVSDKESEHGDGSALTNQIKSVPKIGMVDQFKGTADANESVKDVPILETLDDNEIHERCLGISEDVKLEKQTETSICKDFKCNDGEVVVQHYSGEEHGWDVAGKEGVMAAIDMHQVSGKKSKQIGESTVNALDDDLSKVQLTDVRETHVSEYVSGQCKATKVEGGKQILNEEHPSESSADNLISLPVSLVTKKGQVFVERTSHVPSSSDAEASVSPCSDHNQQAKKSASPTSKQSLAAKILDPLEETSKKMELSSAVTSKSTSEKKGLIYSRLQKVYPQLQKQGITNQPKFKIEKKELSDENLNLSSYFEFEEALSHIPHKSFKESIVFGIGDMVWAKVRSHPWWPAQVYDPAVASMSARKAKKSGRVLVAFFGDSTFAWVEQSQMIPFRPNFEEKAHQTSLRIFCLAVEEALEELCRRAESCLSCKHFTGPLFSPGAYPGGCSGIHQEVQIKGSKGAVASIGMFRPKKTYEFLKSVACSPLDACSVTLQWGECRGYAYGLRRCMVAVQGSESAPSMRTQPEVSSSEEFKKKRSFSLIIVENPTETGASPEESIKSKKAKRDEDRKNSDEEGSLISEEIIDRGASGNSVGSMLATKGLMSIRKGRKDRNAARIKQNKNAKKDHSLHPKRHGETASDKEIHQTRMHDDGEETLLDIAKHSVKSLKRSISKEGQPPGIHKKVRKQSKECQTGVSTLSSKQAMKKSLAEGVPDGFAKVSRRTETGAAEVGLKIDSSIKDNATGKTEVGRKLSKVGNSIIKVASRLTAKALGKFDENLSHTKPEGKKISEPLNVGCPGSPQQSKMLADGEDVSLLDHQQDPEVLAKKAGPGGENLVPVEQSKRGSRVESSSFHVESTSHTTKRSCVQELALAARKRKSEISHDEITGKLPRYGSTSGSQRYDVSKPYTTNTEKSGDYRSYDKSCSSRSPTQSNSSRGSTHLFDEKLSSHMPLGLFMRFPADYPLPSEAELKAAFIPFGPLQMSATKLYTDSASAQVVFKHGRDAESALRHAKKHPIFGPVSVTFRLRHITHSVRAETKVGNPAFSSACSFQKAAREKLGSSSACLKERVGEKQVVSSTVSAPSCSDIPTVSEPSGDIQAEMMTLLRQVSVLVNPSPVISDGT
ncbi:hypothetical protein KP509_29G059500 [Ceratopteris richardii]|uniref:PWWP domain-containing protein n=1 Tax=Ceratopteris richardii TaxID=49495 RepID=A0A8T2R9U2_CERRI|nr:hypothetical protein KP509_29G059500 [Ceratopteris richardii]KAH7292253.1 hypothetical protein KP509_29G059500 [Ceratopteris richardii]